MKLRFRNRKGQVAILMTLAVATLLGVMSLASDVGVLYYSSIQLQKAADAAALAGAGYFGVNSPPTPSCNWGATDAQNGACDYVLNNGIAKGYITNINSPATDVASVPVGAQSVQVQLKRSDIPVFFGRLIGLSNLAAIGSATAIGPLPITTLTRGLFPIGVQFPASMSYDTTMTLSEKSSGQFGPGNWGWLNLPQCTPVGSAPPASYHGGGVPNLTQNITYGSTCSYSIGDTITPETGAKGNSTQPANAIDSLIGSGGNPPSGISESCCSWMRARLRATAASRSRSTRRRAISRVRRTASATTTWPRTAASSRRTSCGGNSSPCSAIVAPTR